MSRKLMWFLAAAWSIALVPACELPESRPANASADPPRTPRGAAISRVVATRCDHEVQCGNVGDGRNYSSLDGCLAEMTRSADADLSPSACPDGVDAARLAECVRQFRRESCKPLATLTRMLACSPSSMCPAPSEPRYGSTDINEL
jgi:hypothetical protein